MSARGGLLRQPAFARLWCASFLAETAEWMLQIALPVLVFQLTGSASLTAAGMVLGLLPAVVLSPVAGLLADRRDRRVVLCVVGLGQLLVALPLLAVGGPDGTWILYAVMAAQSACASMFEPARNALIPELAGTDRVTEANGLMGMNTSVARLAGAWAGGMFLAVGGLSSVIVAYAATLACAVALLLPRFPGGVREPVTAAETAWRSWLDGLAEFRRNRTLRITGIVLALMSLAQGMFLVLFVLFVLRTLGGTEADVGLLRGVQAVGGIAAGAALATFARRLTPVALLGVGTVVFGLLSLATWSLAAITTSVGVFVVLFAVLGAPGVLTTSGLMSVLQSAAGTRMTGRVLSTAFAGVAACTAVGMQAAGALVDVAGLPVLFGAQGTLYVLAGMVAVLGLLVRVSVRRRDVAPLPVERPA